ncbi:hypothetical protein GOV07_00735 [Candidatus Woesearchaeota archaeon]|nr:hypothetical protein [Candidatus Woesearchaeota archaeon]
MTVPLVEQVEGALLWWFETHKYPLEASAVQLERLVSEAKQIPLELPTNVEQNGSTYDGKVSSRTVGDPMHELSLHGIPVIEETAVENWRKLSWGRGKTQYANILESGQPGDGVRQRFLTAEAIAFLYKVAWVEAQVGNAVPREYSVLLRPTKKTLSLYAGIGRVRIGGSTLLRYERSLLLGAALREHWKEPWAVFHQSHKIENIPQKEMLKIYSSSGL